MNTTRILSVGQCAFDHRSLSRLLGERLAAQVTPAETSDDALDVLKSEPYQLVLVNRVIDSDGTPGLELIRTLKADPTLAAIPVMLVSDLRQAQADAVALGACPGFGKSELARPQTLDRIQAALNPGP